MTLEKNLQDIKSHISLKEDTNTGDIVLVGTPDGIFYATVREIKQDIKKNWYNVCFTMLVLPPVELTWTLRHPQMCGELFTIHDEDYFMVAIELGSDPADNPVSSHTCSIQPDRSGKVLKLRPKDEG